MKRSQKVPKDGGTHTWINVQTKHVLNQIASEEQRPMATQLSIIVNEWARANGFAKLVRS